MRLCPLLVLAVACSPTLDGRLVATVSGDAVVFTLTDSTGADPEVMEVRCDTGEEVDGEMMNELTWRIEGDPLTLPITLGELPSGATEVEAYKEPAAGASCRASVFIWATGTDLKQGTDWATSFDHP